MYEFILLKMKCFALQLSPAWDFLLTCLGMSYVLWNPFLFAVFNVRFQQAAREFIKEEVIQINSYDDKKKIWSQRPVHDWTSHASDAFRYLCVTDVVFTGNDSVWGKELPKTDLSWIVQEKI